MATGYELEKDEDDNYIDISYEDIFKIAVESGGAELVSKVSELERTEKNYIYTTKL